MASFIYVSFLGVLTVFIVLLVVAVALYASNSQGSGTGGTCVSGTKKGYYFGDLGYFYGFSPDISPTSGVCVSKWFLRTVVKDAVSILSYDNHNLLYLSTNRDSSTYLTSLVKVNPDGPMSSSTGFNDHPWTLTTNFNTNIHLLNDGTPLCFINNDIVELNNYTTDPNYSQKTLYSAVIPSQTGERIIVGDDVYICVVYETVVIYYEIAAGFTIPAYTSIILTDPILINNYAYLDSNHDLWAVSRISGTINRVICMHRTNLNTLVYLNNDFSSANARISMARTESGKIYVIENSAGPNGWTLNELTVSGGIITVTPKNWIPESTTIYSTICTNGNTIFVASDTTSSSVSSALLNKLDTFNPTTDITEKTTTYSSDLNLTLVAMTCLDDKRICFPVEVYSYFINISDYSVIGPYSLVGKLFTPTSKLYNKTFFLI